MIHHPNLKGYAGHSQYRGVSLYKIGSEEEDDGSSTKWRAHIHGLHGKVRAQSVCSPAICTVCGDQWLDYDCCNDEAM